MAEVTLNPEVENYIHEIDWQAGQANFEEMRQRIVSLFEDGQLIVLKNHPIAIDFDLLNRVNVPNIERYREVSHKYLLYPRLWKARDQGMFLGTFGVNLVKYLRVRAEVRRVNKSLRALLSQIFPTYKVDREQYSWRFLQTGYFVHPMHLDSFGSDEDRQYVRFFVNLDREPRVWRVSHRLDELLERHYVKRDWGRYADMAPNSFCDIVCDYFREHPEAPYHEVKFEQGDLWLVDTRTIPHGVISGNRMVATHFWIDALSMADPSRRLNARIARFHERAAGSAQAAE